MIGQHRVTVQKKARQSDGQGGFIVDWIDDNQIWATIEPMGQKEVIEWQRLGIEVSHNVSMRYNPDISSSNRLKFNNRILEIEGPPINVDELNRKMKLTCVEVFNRNKV